MGKTKKRVYYPTMLYYPVRKTQKRKRIEDFNYTYARNFKPQDLVKHPRKKINFEKSDDMNRFVGNILDLYNIDYNPQFLNFSMKNFHKKIKSYLEIIREEDFYVNSVNKIQDKSDLLELRTVLNKHELHLIMEGLDFLISNSMRNKRQFSENLKTNVSKALKSSKQQGGGYVKKYDLFAYLNGDKRSRIKGRICDIIYYPLEDTDGRETVNDRMYDGAKFKIEKIKNDETIDTCFDAFLHQKILGYLKNLGRYSDQTPYERGEFNDFLDNCRNKNFFHPIPYIDPKKNPYEINLQYVALRQGDLLPKEKNKEDEIRKHYIKYKGAEETSPFYFLDKYKNHQPHDDNFEFSEGRSILDLKYLSTLDERDPEKYDELLELIKTFHELQIPDTDIARNKEKRMKDYLGNITFAITLFGMIPPSFFGEDADYNPFDILSTVICIFEGSTICAVMSALPLISPLIDALSTFSFVRKIFKKFGFSGAMGKRSKAAIKKAQADEIAGLKKQQEGIAQLEANIHAANQNLFAATKNGDLKKVNQIKSELKSLSKQKLGQQEKAFKAGQKQMAETIKQSKKYANPKTQKKIFDKIEGGIELTSKEKFELMKMKEYDTLVKKSFNQLEKVDGMMVKKKSLVSFSDAGLKPMDITKGGSFGKFSSKLEKLSSADEYKDVFKGVSELAERNASYMIDGLNTLDDGLKSIQTLAKKDGVYSNSLESSQIYKKSAAQWEDAKNVQDLQKRASGGSISRIEKKGPEVDILTDATSQAKGKVDAAETNLSTLQKNADEADETLLNLQKQLDDADAEEKLKLLREIKGAERKSISASNKLQQGKRTMNSAQDAFQSAKKAEDAVKYDHPMNKLIDNIFQGKKKADAKDVFRFTDNDIAKIDKHLTNTLGEVGNPLIANKIKMQEKQLKFMEMGDFNLGEFAYLQRTHGGTFSDVGASRKRMEQIEKMQRETLTQTEISTSSADVGNKHAKLVDQLDELEDSRQKLLKGLKMDDGADDAVENIFKYYDNAVKEAEKFKSNPFVSDINQAISKNLDNPTNTNLRNVFDKIQVEVRGIDLDSDKLVDLYKISQKKNKLNSDFNQILREKVTSKPGINANKVTDKALKKYRGKLDKALKEVKDATKDVNAKNFFFKTKKNQETLEEALKTYNQKKDKLNTVLSKIEGQPTPKATEAFDAKRFEELQTQIKSQFVSASDIKKYDKLIETDPNFREFTELRSQFDTSGDIMDYENLKFGLRNMETNTFSRKVLQDLDSDLVARQKTLSEAQESIKILEQQLPDGIRLAKGDNAGKAISEGIEKIKQTDKQVWKLKEAKLKADRQFLKASKGKEKLLKQKAKELEELQYAAKKARSAVDQAKLKAKTAREFRELDEAAELLEAKLKIEKAKKIEIDSLREIEKAKKKEQQIKNTILELEESFKARTSTTKVKRTNTFTYKSGKKGTIKNLELESGYKEPVSKLRSEINNIPADRLESLIEANRIALADTSTEVKNIVRTELKKMNNAIGEATESAETVKRLTRSSQPEDMYATVQKGKVPEPPPLPGRAPTNDLIYTPPSFGDVPVSPRINIPGEEVVYADIRAGVVGRTPPPEIKQVLTRGDDQLLQAREAYRKALREGDERLLIEAETAIRMELDPLYKTKKRVMELEGQKNLATQELTGANDSYKNAVREYEKTENLITSRNTVDKINILIKKNQRQIEKFGKLGDSKTALADYEKAKKFLSGTERLEEMKELGKTEGIDKLAELAEKYSKYDDYLLDGKDYVNTYNIEKYKKQLEQLAELEKNPGFKVFTENKMAETALDIESKQRRIRQLKTAPTLFPKRIQKKIKNIQEQIEVAQKEQARRIAQFEGDDIQQALAKKFMGQETITTTTRVNAVKKVNVVKKDGLSVFEDLKKTNKELFEGIETVIKDPPKSLGVTLSKVDGVLVTDPSLTAKLKYVDYEKAILPPKDGMEMVQEMLDRVASLYLVQNNVDNEVKAMKDNELDKRFFQENNELMGKIFSSDSKKTLSQMGSLLAPGGFSNVFDVVNIMNRASEIFDPGNNARKKRDQMLYSRTMKNLKTRENQRFKSGDAVEIDVTGKIKRTKRLSKNAQKKKDLLQYTDNEIIDFEQQMEYRNRTFDKNVGLNQTLFSDESIPFDNLYSSDLSDLSNSEKEEMKSQKEEMLKDVENMMEERLKVMSCKGPGLNIRQQCRKNEQVVEEFEDKTYCCFNPKEIDQKQCIGTDKVLREGKCKPNEEALFTTKGQPNMGEDGKVEFGKGATCCKTLIEDASELNENSQVGGAKKKNLLRNEVVDDDTLDKQLSKFDYKFRSERSKFNEPLKKLLVKRSNYRIKQKMSLKKEHLQMYRNLKDEALGLEKETQKLESTTFEKMNNSFKEIKKGIFENMTLVCTNSFTQNTVELGTYYETSKVITKYEEVEQKIKKITENPEVDNFVKEFNKLLRNIVKQEEKVKKINKEVQKFKSDDKTLDKEKKKLKELIKQRDNYKAETKEQKSYSKLKIELNKIQKELDELQYFVNQRDKLKKQNLSVESFIRNKNGLFQKFRTKIIEEIDFIKNEYDIAEFLSLPINEIKHLNLVKYLQEIYIDIARMKHSFKVVNDLYKKENTKINKEIESAKKQLEFYYKNLSKIKLKIDQKIFKDRFKNRENNLKLLMEVQTNMVKEYRDNMNFYTKCNDIMVFCDYQINIMKKTNLVNETKQLLLSDSFGVIDITELHEKQDSLNLKTNEKELIKIFEKMDKYLRKINRSRKEVYKTIQDKYVKLSKLKKKVKNARTKKQTRQFKKQMKAVNDRILSYRYTNFGYMNFGNPFDILVFYNILKQVKRNNKIIYVINKENFETLKIPTEKLQKQIMKINKFIIDEQLE